MAFNIIFRLTWIISVDKECVSHHLIILIVPPSMVWDQVLRANSVVMSFLLLTGAIPPKVIGLAKFITKIICIIFFAGGSFLLEKPMLLYDLWKTFDDILASSLVTSFGDVFKAMDFYFFPSFTVVPCFLFSSQVFIFPISSSMGRVIMS